MIEVLGPVNPALPHTIITIAKQATVLPWLRRVPLAPGTYVVNGDVRPYLADRLARRLAAVGVIVAKYVDPSRELTAAVNSHTTPTVTVDPMALINAAISTPPTPAEAALAALLMAEKQVDTELTDKLRAEAQAEPNIVQCLDALAVAEEQKLVAAVAAIDPVEVKEWVATIINQPETASVAESAPAEPEVMVPVPAEQIAIPEEQASTPAPMRRRRRTAAEMAAARAAEAAAAGEPETTPETPGST